MTIYAESAVNNTDILPFGEDTYQVVDESMGGVIAYCHEDPSERIVAALIAAAAAPALNSEASIPGTERINCSISGVRTLLCEGGYIDIVHYTRDWGDGVEEGIAYTQLRAERELPLLAQDLCRNVNHDVALWITPEDSHGRREIITYNTFGLPK